MLLSFMAMRLDTQAAPPARLEPKDRPLCRRETETGSNITFRVCHTKADWALIDQRNGEGVSDYQREFSKGRGVSIEQTQPGGHKP